jgi:hypothetical protein
MLLVTGCWLHWIYSPFEGGRGMFLHINKGSRAQGHNGSKVTKIAPLPQKHHCHPESRDSGMKDPLRGKPFPVNTFYNTTAFLGCHPNSILFLFAYRVTADLYERITVDNDPRFGDIRAMDSFFVGCGGGCSVNDRCRDVACNVSTSSNVSTM